MHPRLLTNICENGQYSLHYGNNSDPSPSTLLEVASAAPTERVTPYGNNEYLVSLEWCYDPDLRRLRRLSRSEKREHLRAQAVMTRAGDIHTNPGPLPPSRDPKKAARNAQRSTVNGERTWTRNEDAVICTQTGCGNLINRGPQLNAAPTCAQDGCDRRCHRKCCGIPTRSEAELTRNGKELTWYCTEHGTGVAIISKIAAPPQPPLVNVPPPQHPPPQAQVQVDTAPPSMQELRESGMTEKEARASREKCGGCPAVLRSNNNPIECQSCAKRFHKKCSIGTYGSASDAAHFICQPCSRKKAHKAHNLADGPTPPLQDNSQRAAPRSKKQRKRIKILQWNANAISTSLHELRERVLDQDYDVAVIQESKLVGDPPEKRSKTPIITGYGTIREDRKYKGGGGLLIFIKTDIRYQRLKAIQRGGMEVLPIRIFLGGKEWVDLTNAYLPNTKPSEQVFDGNLLNANPRSLILSDLNGHSQLWDRRVPTDDRGEKIVDWILEKDMAILNDGSATRVSWDGKESTPDISLAGSRWSSTTTWKVEESLGSDHLPITISIGHTIDVQGPDSRPAKWKRSGVDWEAFGQAVERRMEDLPPEPDVQKRATRFTTILKEVANTHVGKSKPGKKSSSWNTPTVRGLIQKRNRLRRTISQNRKEWIEACREASDAIKDAKTEAWKDYLEGAGITADEKKMWQIIKGLNGTPEANSPNETIATGNGGEESDPVKKANLFARHYARVSNLHMSKDDRNLNLRFKRKLEEPTVEVEEEAKASRPITMTELCSAIARQKRKGAYGEDEIPPTFLKALESNALDELLAIFNASFESADVPRLWRNAIIIPLLKSGKSAKALASYRPVALTSCIVKVLERVIADRMYFLAETKGWFSPLQAGFRRGRSCEDQITRVVQAIEDGFQKKSFHRSVLVLLDFSKAYDTVWREKLLLTMIDVGVPRSIVRWLNAFLSDRRARVCLNNTTGNSVRMKQGLPQGSVLSPLLFLFYINELAKLLPDGNVNSMFADDVAILATAREVQDATDSAQVAVDIVHEWSKEWKLALNADKSECALFSSWSNDSRVEITITVGGEPIRMVENGEARLLGVWVDRSLTFTHHIKKVEAKTTRSLRCLRAVSHADWGWDKRSLRTIFFALTRSNLDYAAPGWQPWVSDTGMMKLERIQNRALRAITGQYQSSPLEALRLETDVPSYATTRKRIVLKAAEKARRAPEDHPKRLALENAVPRRLVNRTSFASMADELTNLLPPESHTRKPLEPFTIAPWNNTRPDGINATVPGIESRKDEDGVKREASLKAIRESGDEIVIYTDGSAKEGTRNGGSAAVITTGDPSSPQVLHTIRRKGREITCSYEEEAAAMEDAIRWADQNGKSTLIVTDSQSLCKALLAHELDPAIARLKKMLTDTENVKLQWVPSHCDIPGNELADKAANEAREMVAPAEPISLNSICALINSTLTDGPILHQRTAQVYAKKSRTIEQTKRARSDQVLLAQLRTGHHMAFRSYKHRLDRDLDKSCPECGALEHDLEHWLVDCPAGSEWRMRHFGVTEGKLEWLTSDPDAVVAYARSSLLVLDAML